MGSSGSTFHDLQPDAHAISARKSAGAAFHRTASRATHADYTYKMLQEILNLSDSWLLNMPKYSANDTELLKFAINSKVRGITFCGMKGFNEPIVHQSGKYAESTWGIILHFENNEKATLTWGEDKEVGDPFFINFKPHNDFINIYSELKNVTEYSPWSRYIDKGISKANLHRYLTNYSDITSWHDVPWGIEFVFDDSQRMLIAALHHGEFLNYLLCADEIVVCFDQELIDLVIQSHSEFISEWS